MTYRTTVTKLLREMLIAATYSANPTAQDLEYQHGLLHEMKGDSKRALDCYRYAVESNLDAKFNYGRLLSNNPELRGKMPRTLPNSLMQASGFDGSFFAQYYLGHMHMNTDNAVSQYWLDMAKDKFTPARRLLGVVLFQQGKIGDAVKTLAPLIRVGDPQVTKFISSIKSSIRARNNLANDALSKVVSYPPKNVLLLRERYKTASPMLEEANGNVVVPLRAAPSGISKP